MGNLDKYDLQWGIKCFKTIHWCAHFVDNQKRIIIEHSSDIIIVGSGVSAVHAAYPIVEAGLSVTMLDVGHNDNPYDQEIPDAPFSVIRKSDLEQHRYFLGSEFEGISFAHASTGQQVTPPRKYVLHDVENLAPIFSSDFMPAESFATGGLSGAWGAVCHPYLDNELDKCLLPPFEIRRGYEKIAKRIGISGTCDGIESFVGELSGLQPPSEITSNARLIYDRYQRDITDFNKNGIYMGHPLLALLTRPLKNRVPNRYYDMDFWTNKGGSVYRADLTVKELQKKNNFNYERNYLVESFSEDVNGNVMIKAKYLLDNTYRTFRGRKLILAAGALGTTRIVLRSLNHYDHHVPLLCNPHTYVPCIHYTGIGKGKKDKSHSLAQLMMLYDPYGDREHIVMSQIYSYRSLMLFRLLQDMPLAYKESLRLMKSLVHYLMIFIIQHEDKPSPDKYCSLKRNEDGTGDYLEIVYKTSDESLRQQQVHEKKMVKNIRKLGCLPIKKVRPGHGASVHYAGQFPLSHEDKPLTTELSGRLRETRSVYIADGSVFPYLPAKGLTFTLMANADRIGESVLEAMT